MDRNTFERIVTNKAIIGIPFTLEDVMITGKCKHMVLPACDCAPEKATGQHTTWMTVLVKRGVVAKVGEVASSNPAARGRKVSVYGSPYYREEELSVPDVA